MMTLWPYYRCRKGNWFIDSRPNPEKTRARTLKLGLLILGAYSLFMTGNEIYRQAADEGYEKGRIRGYEIGLQRGKESITCPKPWQTTMAAPLTID
ncbi:hypothetical protein LCGC14_2092780 [marine sediment metagenome]|uniref:Uncharacterized protein n=1 Tax=marine sediment metagenome TaxID=412755 RepID=A0A0F9ECF3_9ZZZZ